MNYKNQKILVLGSGALKIGEAGEFDYSGSQAMKALREEGVKIVLVNPNIATIQTSPLLADEIYFLPVTPEFVVRVIAKERPDAILLSFGGQTALNCGVALHKSGILKKYRVAVLGTPVGSIILTEDRQKFADHLKKIKIPIPESGATASAVSAESIAKKIGYPVMVRAAFTLGGQKSGVARDLAELREIAAGALAVAPQILVEKYLEHYKEIEYEVVRDRAGNCVTVCNMENFDPMGIHTGDSIVVAPSQTLTNEEYHGLRRAAIDIVQSLAIVGECNVQFALNPKPKGEKLEYYVIEVNARLSRSSALASKATGYPLAYVAAKLALGQILSEVKNQVTKVTQSFFEPALDYVVVKIPRWDIEKFKGAEERIGSAMKSVGEVMAIGRTFEEALQKAVRMLHSGAEGVTENGFGPDKKSLERFLHIPTPKRLFAVAEALKRGIKAERIHELSGIDLWFIWRINNIVQWEKKLLKHKKLGHDLLLKLKQLGFSDRRIALLRKTDAAEIRKLRHSYGLRPSVFQIDTLAGEAPAKTNYLYLTYNGAHHDVSPLGKRAVVVLGSGPYHIGSSVEFDWSCVHTALSLRKYGKQSIIVNCNPETVSTDYDMSRRLYFEELTFETISEIYEFEKPSGVVVSVGGQTPNNLARDFSAAGFHILGTTAANIDRAEDRNKFSALLDSLGIPQPLWKSFVSMSEALRFAREVGYPVLVRPSYVLSGSAMSVCFDNEELRLLVEKAAVINRAHPVTISKFITGAKELELDAVAQRGKILAAFLSEHVENAGVHSGDATIVYPAQKVYTATEQRILQIAESLARDLQITGPFNIQFLVKENKAFVIEINLRASRTFPLLSKATNVNLADLLVAAFFGRGRAPKIKYPDYVVVKSPQFSFSRLQGADPVLRVEMASTGEVACFGDTFEEALLKSIYSSITFSPRKSALLALGGAGNKKRFLDAARRLVAKGYKLYATGTTHRFLQENAVPSKLVSKVYEGKKPDVVDLINSKRVGFVVNLSEQDEGPERHHKEHVSDGYLIRRAAVDNNTPLFTNSLLARAFVRAVTSFGPKDLKIKSWREYTESNLHE